MTLEEHFRSLSRIELRIFCPLEPIKMVSVRCGCQIGSLQSLWPAPRRILFNGLELDERMTFEWYGVQDGDALVVVSRSDCDFPHACAWINLSRDREGFNDSIQWIVDIRTANESARLRDLRQIRFDHNARAFQRLSLGFLQTQLPAGETDPSDIDYAPPPAPSTSALPVLWKSE
jgi:hypothetical protein